MWEFQTRSQSGGGSCRLCGNGQAAGECLVDLSTSLSTVTGRGGGRLNRELLMLNDFCGSLAQSVPLPISSPRHRGALLAVNNSQLGANSPTEKLWGTELEV